ncbi:MAG TPA: hypothetical protein VHS74_14110 [Solirubrobacterales bacterium]|jgi:hypothetical protein|nr:hypothetical protein [Solirubrobacterales bacterium]
MSATSHLGRLAPAHQPRESVLTRLRLRVRRDELDRKLAAGADPRRHHDLGRRAEELTGVAERRRIARALDRVIDDVSDSPPPPPRSLVPPGRPAMRACAPRLRAIAGRLRSDHTIPAAGVARVALLVDEPTSPLYAPTTTEDALRHLLAEVAGAL